MKLKRLIAAALVFGAAMCSTAFAAIENNTFTVSYSPENMNFTVSGTTTESDRVLLTVKSGDGEIYYANAYNAVNGSFSFAVPMNEYSPAGTYDFRLAASGTEFGTANVSEAFGEGNNEAFQVLNLKAVQCSGTASASVLLKNKTEAEQTLPKLLIAVYEKESGKLISASMSNPSKSVLEGLGAIGIDVSCDFTQEEGKVYYSKAMLWENMNNMRPLTTCVSGKTAE